MWYKFCLLLLLESISVKTVLLHAASATKMNALHLIIEQLDAHPIIITAKACLLRTYRCKQTAIPKAMHPLPSSSSPPLHKYNLQSRRVRRAKKIVSPLGHKNQEG